MGWLDYWLHRYWNLTKDDFHIKGRRWRIRAFSFMWWIISGSKVGLIVGGFYIGYLALWLLWLWMRQ